MAGADDDEKAEEAEEAAEAAEAEAEEAEAEAGEADEEEIMTIMTLEGNSRGLFIAGVGVAAVVSATAALSSHIATIKAAVSAEGANRVLSMVQALTEHQLREWRMTMTGKLNDSLLAQESVARTVTRAVAGLLEEQRAGQLRNERLWHHNLPAQVRAQLAPDLQAATAALRRVLAAQQRQPQAPSSYRSAAPSSYRSAVSQPQASEKEEKARRSGPRHHHYYRVRATIPKNKPRGSRSTPHAEQPPALRGGGSAPRASSPARRRGRPPYY